MYTLKIYSCKKSANINVSYSWSEKFHENLYIFGSDKKCKYQNKRIIYVLEADFWLESNLIGYICKC